MNELQYQIALICAKRGVQLVRVEDFSRLGFIIGAGGSFMLAPPAANTFYLLADITLFYNKQSAGSGVINLEWGFDQLTFDESQLPIVFSYLEADQVYVNNLSGNLGAYLYGKLYKVTTTAQ